MPIYEYACPGCGHRFEHFQKMSDPLLTACPSCEAEGLRKLVSATSFHLKGGGWYKDHYGLKSAGGDSSSTSESTSDSSSTSSSTSESASSGSETSTTTSTASSDD